MTAHPWSSTYAELGLDWSVIPEIPEHTLSGYVRAHAQAFPEREAIVHLGTGISYAELDRLADRFAACLRDHGCQRGDVLGVLMPTMPQYVIALVAAARLGVVTTSISPLLKPPELRHQARDAGVKVILTLASLFETTVAPVIGEIPTLAHVLVAEAPPEVEAAPCPEAGSFEQVLYLQYTGGTTGAPKGAKLSSRNLFVNNAQADVFYGYRLGQEIVASAFPLFHIGGLAVLFNALRMAGTTILITDPRNLDMFCGELQQRPPTVLAAVPALYQMLCAHPVFRSLDFSRLRIAASGGAPFAEADIRRLEAVIGSGKLCEVYGMTETSPVQTCNPPKRVKPGFVGIPVPGTEVRIVDVHDRTKTMPLGEPGEIIAAGPQVMSGYLNRPDDDALRSFDGRTWMYTGDIGFMDEEGYVKLCDRSKDMLIVGGFKVFSVEVENKLLELSEIAACAVVGRADPDRAGNEIVQLHVQKSASCALEDEALRARILEFCRAHMASYKVPKEIFFPAALPLTAVGKIDKKALRR
jgi:long-chain acyl-CoA synthetase